MRNQKQGISRIVEAIILRTVGRNHDRIKKHYDEFVHRMMTFYSGLIEIKPQYFTEFCKASGITPNEVHGLLIAIRVQSGKGLRIDGHVLNDADIAYHEGLISNALKR